MRSIGAALLAASALALTLTACDRPVDPATQRAADIAERQAGATADRMQNHADVLGERAETANASDAAQLKADAGQLEAQADQTNAVIDDVGDRIKEGAPR